MAADERLLLYSLCCPLLSGSSWGTVQCPTTLPGSAVQRNSWHLPHLTVPSSRPPQFVARCAHVLHHASPSGTATAFGHSAGSGGESTNDFPHNSTCYAILRNETYTTKHIHLRMCQTTLQAQGRILSNNTIEQILENHTCEVGLQD